MSSFVKIIFGTTFFLMGIIVAEVLFYFGGLYSQNTVSTIESPTITPTYSQAQLDEIHTAYYNRFLPLKYSEEIDKIYIDQNPVDFAKWRKNMGADFASWIALSTYTKGQIESLVVTSKLKGTVSKLEKNKVNAENIRYSQFLFTGSDGVSSVFIENEDAINSATFVQLVDGVEVPISFDDIKDGDTLVFEVTKDITKAPRDIQTDSRSVKVTKL